MEDKTFSFPDDVKTRVRSLLAKQLEQTGASNLPDSLPDALLTISAAGTSKEMIAKNLKVKYSVSILVFFCFFFFQIFYFYFLGFFR